VAAVDIGIDRQGEIVVVAPQGELDAASAPQLRADLDRLLSDGVRCFVVDLAAVGFMDSSGLASLVGLFKRVRTSDGDVRLSGVAGDVRRVLELTRLDRVFDLYDDRATAVASFL
jgi:anti-sigma B factor antagonist